MTVVYTDEALADLTSISDWLSVHCPTAAPHVALRIRSLVVHISRWPESSRRVADRPDVRAAPLVRYPYVIFYRVAGDTVEFCISITQRGIDRSLNPACDAIRAKPGHDIRS